MIKVSIIVPVYNVEPYLEKCLESLINQTLQEIEIIVVNDGSTDNSQKIIDKYAKNSNKIRAFYKENGGLSDARNYGLPYATGEYIGYVDSDDFVELTMFEQLYEKAINDGSDIVECDLRHTYEDSEDTEHGKHIYDKNEIIMQGRSVVWNKIYKREWLNQTGVVFLKGAIYEDVDFFVRLVPYITKYSYIDDALIHYVQRSSSINNLSTLKTMDIIKILTNIHDYYKEHNFYNEYKEALEYLFTRILLCSSMARMSRILDKKERVLALEQNWKILYEFFPKWKKNVYLKGNKSIKGIFMKCMNPFTYKIVASVFNIKFRVQRIVT